VGISVKGAGGIPPPAGVMQPELGIYIV
jgi:hypothetical protein